MVTAAGSRFPPAVWKPRPEPGANGIMATTIVHTNPPAAAVSGEKPVNRWLIPLGAIAVHLSIGSVYAWSTLNRPIKTILAGAPWWSSPPYITFTAAIAILGLTAAFGGPWVERHGPRAAAIVAACFFGSGLALGGFGLMLHSPLVVLLGMGLLSGIGAGFGYICPVSTLLRWFPDRRGMATGMAIMGFGGGAFLAGYLNVYCIGLFGIQKMLVVLGGVYFLLMMAGAAILRRPPDGWQPANWTPPAASKASTGDGGLTRAQAFRTPRFYLLWGMLFINTTAGIGVLAQASPMMQDLFRKSSIEAGLVVSFISLFNAGGRFFWASLSDKIGRRTTYLLFFLLQLGLFLLIPSLAAGGKWLGFELAMFAVFSMYGGGFATMPAFAADCFGVESVSAIYGVILTAWSAAAIVGPLLITELSARAKASLAPGASRAHIYDQPIHLLSGLLLVGVALALMTRPTKEKEAR